MDHRALVADRFVNWSGQGLLSLLFFENKIRSGFTQSLGRAVCVVGPMDQRQIMHGAHQVPMAGLLAYDGDQGGQLLRSLYS